MAYLHGYFLSRLIRGAVATKATEENPEAYHYVNIGAGRENRTLVADLASQCITTMLYPHLPAFSGLAP